MCKPVCLLGALVTTLLASDFGYADVFQLKDGGQVVGEQVEREGGGDYVIRTADGAEVTLERNQVQRIVQQDETLAEYVRRSRTAPDTAEAHRQLAAWCREHKLLDESQHHLARVAELDPTDEDARRSLGFQRVGNRWLSRDELMAERGMQFYDGRFRTRQDVAIRERNKEGESIDVDWFTRLRTWRGWLDNRREDRVAEAQAQITAINDPGATPALVRLLNDEADPWIFELLLSVVGRLDHPLAVQTLVAYSLNDDDAEIRAKCMDYLLNGARPVSILPYVEALKHKDNIIVNRAGESLGKIGDPAAISPLIDALVTNHKYQIQPDQSGRIGAAFNPSGGGGGLNLGGNGPQIIKLDKENLKVQRALQKLSGNQDFDYDEQAWRHWYVDMQMREQYNARRDK